MCAACLRAPLRVRVCTRFLREHAAPRRVFVRLQLDHVVQQHSGGDRAEGLSGFSKWDFPQGSRKILLSRLHPLTSEAKGGFPGSWRLAFQVHLRFVLLCFYGRTFPTFQDAADTRVYCRASKLIEGVRENRCVCGRMWPKSLPETAASLLTVHHRRSMAEKLKWVGGDFIRRLSDWFPVGGGDRSGREGSEGRWRMLESRVRDLNSSVDSCLSSPLVARDGRRRAAPPPDIL